MTIKQCASVHRESGVRCERPPHKDAFGTSGDHRANGLTWSEARGPDDPINHPKHYTSHPSGIECIDVTRHMNFNRGNAVKYIWRAGEKGPAIEDLRKAIWYLQDEVKRLERDGVG